MTVVEACTQFWNADRSNCSKFACDVAGALGVTLAGNANAIADILAIGQDGWEVLDGGVTAAARAAAGDLVLAGLRGDAQTTPNVHGHVVVIVPGPLNRGLYPTAWWGSDGGVPYQNTTLNYAWVAGDRDRVHYAARTI
jgi:hypothetical protein